MFRFLFVLFFLFSFNSFASKLQINDSITLKKEEITLKELKLKDIYFESDNNIQKLLVDKKKLVEKLTHFNKQIDFLKRIVKIIKKLDFNDETQMLKLQTIFNILGVNNDDRLNIDAKTLVENLKREIKKIKTKHALHLYKIQH